MALSFPLLLFQMGSSVTFSQPGAAIAAGFNNVMQGLLMLILLVRLSFLGTGAMTFPDEARYYASYDAIDGLFPISHGGFDSFNANIQQTQGRPGDALLRVVPAGIQLQLEKMTGISHHSQGSLLIPVVFNYFILLWSLYLFYRIAQLLLHHQSAALLSTLVYACLVNTNLYIRHVLPYDTGMLCVFGTFFLVLRMKAQPQRRTVRAVFAIGALAGLAFAVYPRLQCRHCGGRPAATGKAYPCATRLEKPFPNRYCLQLWGVGSVGLLPIAVRGQWHIVL